MKLTNHTSEVNYYLKYRTSEDQEIQELLHMGKSRIGWKFLFTSHENPEIKSFSDWRGFIVESRGKIINEWGGEIRDMEFLDLVKSKQHMQSYHNANSEYENFYFDAAGFQFCKFLNRIIYT